MVTGVRSDALTLNAPYPVGVTTIAWTATDAYGHSVDCTQKITVTDNEAPVVNNCPANIYVSTGTGRTSCDQEVNWVAPTATDNCGNVTVTSTHNPGATFPVGTTKVTYTFTDSHNNTSICIFTVTVKDNTAPVINTPGPVTANCQDNTGVGATGSATASDNCGTVTVAYNDVSTQNPSLSHAGHYNYTITRTWTATDAAGNQSSGVQVITVHDITKPVITCPGDITLAYGSLTTPGGTNGTATATDNCSPVTIASSDVSTQVSDVNNAGHYNYTITRTWRATDASGNWSECIQVITVIDKTTPLISCPGNVVTSCSSSTAPDATGVATATDDSHGPVTVTYTDASTMSGSSFSAGYYNYVITRTWKATDASGNYSFCVQTITVQDITKPVVICKPITVTLVNGVATITPASINNGSYDNCSPVTLSISQAVFNCNNLGSNTVTLTGTDVSGNTSSCQATVTVVGLMPSCTIASVPTNSTYTGGVSTSLYLGYGAQSTTLQVTSPAAGAPYTYSWSGSAAGMLSSTSTANPVFTPTAGGSYTFTVVSTNKFGCSSTCSITICVTDIRVIAQNNSTPNCNHQSHSSGNCSHSNHGHSCSHSSHSSANCPDSDDDSQTMCDHGSHDASDCSHKGHNHKVCDHKSHSKYACDHRDNDDDDEQKECDHKSHSSSDCSHKGHNHSSCSHKSHSKYDCDHDRSHGSDEKVCDHKSHSSSDCSHDGHHHGYCSHKAHNASDCHHNGGQEDDGDDDNKKVYICHVPPGNPGKTLTLSISVNAVAAHLANHSGDRLGSCDQQPCSAYTDTEKPVITCPASLTLACGGATTPAVTGSASATDNSGNVVITYSDATSGTTITRTWTAVDPSGNTSSCVQTITVAIPFTTTVVSTPTGNVNTGGISTNLYLGYGAQTTTLAVTGSLPSTGAPYTYSWSGSGTGMLSNTSISNPVFTPTSGGSYTFTVITTNKFGCGYSRSITICVKDIRERNRYGVLTNSGKVYVCHVPPGNIGNAHTICISVNAVPAHVPLHGGDMLGSCDQVCGSEIVSRPPVITTPPNITVSCASAATPANCGIATATDNNGVSITATYSDAVNGNTITRTWTATDASGNYTIGEQTITVVDNVKPVITDLPDVTLNCGGSTAPSATGTPTATDNCSAVTITNSDAVSGNTIMRTWKATDAADNYSTSVQVITVSATFTANISSVPASSVYTGGISTNLYLGYGAQSTTLQVGSLPLGGAPYTYAWSGSFANKLNSTTSSSPLFTPAVPGYATFNVAITNKYGCTYTASISICVTDIRVPNTNGAKVYVCHTPKYGAPQTSQVTIAQVPSHIGTNNSCGSYSGTDRLGSCDQAPCNTTITNSITGITQTATKEGGDAVTNKTTEEELKVTVMPNPSTTFFTLKLESKYETPVNMRVMDESGRVVDARSKLGANSTMQIGHNYSSGTYYAELIQGTKRKVVQLIKARG
jgi:hypothetical protein